MKVFTDFIRKIKRNKISNFILWVLTFYGLMVILYVYLMSANLSTAPQFVYSQF